MLVIVPPPWCSCTTHDPDFKEKKLFKLITLPIGLVLKLVRLPFTIMGCIAKLGCLIVVAGIVAAIVAVLVYF